jgi:hypothetical protein
MGEKHIVLDILVVTSAVNSDRIEIKSYFVIESNVFAEIESNDFFDFSYDSIRFDLEENLSKKTPNCCGKK